MGLDWTPMERAVRGRGDVAEQWRRAAEEAAPKRHEGPDASPMWPAGGIAILLAAIILTGYELVLVLPAGFRGLLIDGAFLALVLAVLAVVLVDLWAGSR